MSAKTEAKTKDYVAIAERAILRLEADGAKPTVTCRAPVGPLMPSGTDQAINIGLHHQLKDSLGDAAQ